MPSYQIYTLIPRFEILEAGAKRYIHVKKFVTYILPFNCYVADCHGNIQVSKTWSYPGSVLEWLNQTMSTL